MPAFDHIVDLVKSNHPELTKLNFDFQLNAKRGLALQEAFLKNDYIVELNLDPEGMMEESYFAITDKIKKNYEKQQQKKMHDAASKIQSFYRIKRLHRYTQYTRGFHPEFKSIANLTHLFRRLKDDPASLLTLKEKQNLNDLGLLPEEQNLLNKVVNDIQLTIKHKSEYLTEISKNGNYLLSLDERKRLGLSTENSHTGPVHGRQDNIYFTIGSPQHRNIVSDDAKAHTIIHDLPKVGEKSKKAAQGLWVSGHSSKTSYAKKFGTTKRSIRTVLEDVKSDYHKTAIRYDYKDGSFRERLIDEFEEVASYPDLRTFLGLKLVEELRYIGQPYRDHVLKNLNVPGVIESAIDHLFEYPFFEAKVPVRYDLNQPSIKIIPPLNTNQNVKAALELHEAAEKGDIKKVSELLSLGISVNVLNDKGYTPLISALIENQIDMAAFLLTKNADPTILNSIGVTPLELAAEHGFTDILNSILMFEKSNSKPAMIKECVGVNSWHWNNTALKSAAKAGHLACVKLLVKHGASLALSGHDALCKAIEEGHRHVVAYLLTLSIDVNAPHQNILSPLMLAAKKGDCDILQALLAKGADPNFRFQSSESTLREMEGKTALMMASEEGHIDAVRLLLNQQDLNVTMVDEYGCNALDLVLAKIKQLNLNDEVYKNYQQIVTLLQKKLNPTDASQLSVKYFNKSQAGVALIRGKDKAGNIYILLGRREKEKQYVLPGGEKDITDIDFQAAAAREAFEETSIPIPTLITQGKCKARAFYQYDQFDSLIHNPANDRDDEHADSNLARRITHVYLFDVGDIKALTAKANDDLVELRWINEKELKSSNIDILYSNRALINAAFQDIYPIHGSIEYKTITQLLRYEYDGGNLLLNAIKLNDFDQVSLLLAEGVSANAKARTHISPFMAACRYANYDILNLLLHYGADINASCGAYVHARESKFVLTTTPLMVAIAREDNQLIDYCIRQGAKIDDQAVSFEDTAFSFAVKKQSRDTIRKFLALNIDLSQDRCHSICFSAINNAFEKDVSETILTLELLLQNGANINASDNYYPILTKALRHNSPILIGYLIACGADTTLRDYEGFTPLQHAEKRQNIDPDIIKMLSKPDTYRRRGARFNYVINAAIQSNDVPAVLSLLNQGLRDEQLIKLLRLECSNEWAEVKLTCAKKLFERAINIITSSKMTEFKIDRDEQGKPTVHVYFSDQEAAKIFAKKLGATIRPSKENFYVRIGSERCNSLFELTDVYKNFELGSEVFQRLAEAAPKNLSIPSILFKPPTSQPSFPQKPTTLVQKGGYSRNT